MHMDSLALTVATSEYFRRTLATNAPRTFSKPSTMPQDESCDASNCGVGAGVTRSVATGGPASEGFVGESENRRGALVGWHGGSGEGGLVRTADTDLGREVASAGAGAGASVWRVSWPGR